MKWLHKKNIIFQGKTPEDDCRCETCKNGELFLEAIRSYFMKQKQKNLTKDLAMDLLEFVQLGVCSFKSYECMNGPCNACPGSALIAEISGNLEKVESLTSYKWTTKNKVVYKISEEISGEEAASKLVELISGEKLRLHRSNISRQYVELKWLKSNLKIDEVIFPKTMTINRDMRSRVPILAMNVLLFTAACYFNRSVAIENWKIDEEENLLQLPVVTVSNEISHDRDVDFSNNNILIDMTKKLEPSINTFHFWSDVCAGQFCSKYVSLIFILSCRNQFDLELWRSPSL